MDSEARKAVFLAARAESLEILERTAGIEIEYRHHDEGGHLTSWSKTMPPKPAPPPPLSVADVECKIADALPGVATVIHEVRQQLRAEFAAEIDKVKNAHDLYRAALLARIEKLERGIGDADVIDLPALPMRNTRRAG